MSAAAGGGVAIVAVVQINGSDEALVLNRRLQFVYELVGQDYIGTDGPFRDVLRYGRGYGMKAFAGRELSLPMTDGSTVKVKNRWWQALFPGMRSVAHADVESLRKCYVFYGGACIAPDDYDALRATYTGCVYPYWDYQKVIAFDSMRKDLYRRVFHEERRRRALTAEVRRKHRELVSLRAALSNIEGGKA